VRFLGLDVGTKTIGLAVSDGDGIIATPRLTLERRGIAQDAKRIVEQMKAVEAEEVVIGLPLELNGEEGDAARLCRRVGEEIARQLNKPVFYWDERFTTVGAERALLEGNVSRADRKRKIDQVAAALLLQSFLDARGSRQPEEDE
jgi:putative Holliday junction resolvase